ncbi:MAG: hypothetical protein V2I56_10420 [Desulfobacteraceae bacterium]|jgi:hypothetical protein|nr:hypothetical protein [Desulfobacteraceae bacterium]
MTKTLTAKIAAISIFMNSGSFTGLEFEICLLFGIWNLEFPVYPGSAYG